MTISKKIIVGLMLILFVAITFNGFWLKEQYQDIDKSDLYWEFDERESLGTYTHINIEGGNKIYVSIVDGLDDILYYKNEPVTDFTFKVANDTLKIKFATDLFTKRIAGKRWKSYRMVIGCKNLKSLILNNSYADLELESKDRLILKANGYSIVKIKSPNVKINSLKVELSGNSFALFSDEQNPLSTDLLAIKLIDSSFINLNKTIARRFLPSLKDNARIIYGSGIKTFENGQIENYFEPKISSFHK